MVPGRRLRATLGESQDAGADTLRVRRLRCDPKDFARGFTQTQALRPEMALEMLRFSHLRSGRGDFKAAMGVDR